MSIGGPGVFLRPVKVSKTSDSSLDKFAPVFVGENYFFGEALVALFYFLTFLIESSSSLSESSSSDSSIL